jgi:hypothetical protein
MRAINHALTGSLIGLTLGDPIVALPLAVASHFICDAIPHHASSEDPVKALRKPIFKQLLIGDAVLCVALVIFLALAQPEHWILAAVCAFLAASPDFLYVRRFITAKRNQPYTPGRFIKWTTDIQWFQRPIGWVVEIVWFAGCLALLSQSLYLR